MSEVFGTPRRARRSSEGPATVSEIQEGLQTWFKKRGSRDILELLRVFSASITWKTAASSDVLSLCADLYEELAPCCPNTRMSPSKLLTVLILR